MQYLILILIPFIYFFYYSKYLHIFQLEGYKPGFYARWIIDNFLNLYPSLMITLYGILAIPILSYTGVSALSITIALSCFSILFYILDFFNTRKTKYKKPLVYTWRAKRLVIGGYIVLVIYMLISALFMNSHPFIFLLMLMCSWGLALINILISNFLLKPIEKLCGLRFINEAKQIIKARSDLIVVGITGSFGKTSVKFILQTILSEKYKTYATPDSYNTTFGNVRVIREQLTNMHQVYISEMGARNIGDIKEICNIVKPKYGIITSIGNQHLETFKTVENITKTKYELIDSLPEDGIAFFPDDGNICKKLYDNELRKKVLYGSTSSDVYAKDITTTPQGSMFTIVSKIDESEFKCETRLLGEHNVANIVGCVAIAKQLGLTNQEISRGIAKIAPIPHRLELIPNTNGLVIIDDAFNSNPFGAKAALSVISSFPGRKIIITPGMIELGTDQYSANFNFGKQIAEVCDITILVGKKITTAIQEGIKQSNFNLSNMYVVSSLDEATKTLTSVGQVGDVVLFENDLPDNFNE